MTKYEKFDYEKVRKNLEDMRLEIAYIVDWVCQHDELEVKVERRNLLETLWRAKDGVGHAAYIIHDRVMVEDDES